MSDSVNQVIDTVEHALAELGPDDPAREHVELAIKALTPDTPPEQWYGAGAFPDPAKLQRIHALLSIRSARGQDLTDSVRYKLESAFFVVIRSENRLPHENPGTE